MASHCQVCEKAPVAGVSYVHRGLAKAKGGVGVKVTGKTKRWFKPNLQKMKVVETNGHVHRVWVCTKCLRDGKITKAPKQSILREIRAEKGAAKKK
ncbi:MAG: 50S ribosomal protein L28 [Planctomycetota bacterium]|nr:50S ribosomal protein L28 [Planctomycetota bacterium]